MRRQQALLLGAVAMMASALVQAEFAGAEFAADVISRTPDGQSSVGKMYVGDGRMRMEMSQQGREIVRISDQNRQVEWILFPDQQVYLERTAPADAPAAPAASGEVNPCVGMSGLECRRVGEEVVGGRPAVKWEMTMTHEGQTLTGTQWIDVARGMPLKQEMSNGPGMELRLVGNAEIDGRAVEHWEMQMRGPDGATATTKQWYDPELRLAVREEFEGGFVRELKEIRVGPQPDHLFTVPAGYTRTEMPTQQ